VSLNFISYSERSVYVQRNSRVFQVWVHPAQSLKSTATRERKLFVTHKVHTISMIDIYRCRNVQLNNRCTIQ